MYITIPEHYLAEIRLLSPASRVVVLTDDRHAVRQERAAQLTRRFIDLECAHFYRRRELEIYRAADLVLAITAAEAGYVTHLAPATPVVVVPYVGEQPAVGEHQPFHKRSGLLFIADFSNGAARHGYSWFIRDVWPKLRSRIPDIRLTVAGNKTDSAAQTAPPGIRCTGHIPDLSAALASHRVFVSPVRVATGIATKNVLALSHGIPLVTTSVAAEALGDDSAAFLVADSPDEMADSIEEVYNDCDLWAGLAHRGKELVSKLFSPEACESAVRHSLHTALTTRSTADLPSFVLRGTRGVTPIPPDSTEAEKQSASLLQNQAQLDHAVELLRLGCYNEALEEFRFAMVRMPGQPANAQEADIYFRLLGGIEQCKIAAGDHHAAAACRQDLVVVESRYRNFTIRATA